MRRTKPRSKVAKILPQVIFVEPAVSHVGNWHEFSVSQIAAAGTRGEAEICQIKRNRGAIERAIEGGNVRLIIFMDDSDRPLITAIREKTSVPIFVITDRRSWRKTQNEIGRLPSVVIFWIGHARDEIPDKLHWIGELYTEACRTLGIAAK